MKPQWLNPSSIQEAKECQKEMAERVSLKDEFGKIKLIGGMDVSNNLYDPAKMIYAAIVLLGSPNLEVIEDASCAERQEMPYIPGLLGFREAPALVRAYAKLKQKPDLIFVDGHGISHPRGLGIASHIGVLLDVPTVGVAKSILVGAPAEELAAEPGAEVPLMWQGRSIATLLRSKKRAGPLIISAGHRVSPKTAVTLVKECLKGYRLPEPTRQAHLAANRCRKQFLEKRSDI